MKIKAQSYVSIVAPLGDISRAEIQADKAGSLKCKPASLTKVIVVMTVLDHVQNIEESITVNTEDLLSGSGDNLVAGDKLSWRDAFHNMLMASSNTSANAVVRNLGLRLLNIEKTDPRSGDALLHGIAALNEKALSLGMKDTHFLNASGLDSPGMHTTARDMAVMGAAALDYPELLKTWGKPKHTIRIDGERPRDVEITSTVKILTDEYPNICGGKTGTLPDGTQNLLIHSIGENGGHTVTALLQRGGDRYDEIHRVLTVRHSS